MGGGGAETGVEEVGGVRVACVGPPAVICFALSDFTYYAGHRIVHRWPAVYKFVHKHHHGEAEPIRGWADTCNAHPTDFFYTGFCTSPLSSLWLFPPGSIHIVA